MQREDGPMPPASLDPFEARYMIGSGHVLARYRGRPGAGYHAMFGFVALVVALSASGPAQILFALALLVPIWLMFAIVRVTVTPSHLDVKYGPFGPRIPLAQIDSVEPTRYHWSSWGGWGIRRKLGTGEVLYAMPGDQGHGVRVRWTPPDGRQHSAVVGVREPSTIVDAVAAARRVLPPAAAGHALPSGSTPSTPSAPQDPAGDQVDRGDIDVSR